MTSRFFSEPEEQSLVKAQIVVSYFEAWSRIMAARAQRIGYFDFYAGPGRYETGEKSTPILILERAVANPRLRERLVSVFNDANPAHTQNLSDEINALPGIDSLRYQPEVLTGEVNDELVGQLESISTIPALSFIDPWGYKGLSLRLIRAVIKDWGCEAIFFFNYNRINMGVANRLVEPHMESLFGDERLGTLREELDGSPPEERERVLRRALGEALTEKGAPYLIPFRFLRAGGRPSHYICFVTKSPLGYSIMKDIMASRGVVDDDGVPKFEYLPALSGRQLPFDEDRPLRGLSADLLARFHGEVLTVQQIYERHNVGTPFVRKNYKQVLLEMESRAEITCAPDLSQRRRGTLGDRVQVTFS